VEIRGLISELYAVERLVPGPFPGDAAAQMLPRRTPSRCLSDGDATFAATTVA
jgi:hypothetical protein